MFNESDPILGPSTLERGFLEEEDEEAQGGDRGGEEGGTLEECLGLPPSSPPSHPSTGDSVEPLSSSYMLFKVGVNITSHQIHISHSLVLDGQNYAAVTQNPLYPIIQDIGVNEEASPDQTDLSASPPLPYVPPPPLSLPDITTHESQDGLGPADVSESLINPGEEGDDQEGSTGFEFEEREEEEVEKKENNRKEGMSRQECSD